MPGPSRHVILGTAGHIDHGKTELIRALTGVETDRLREEKERGISIELGFARFDLPDGTALGVVDVPGHEKFVRTMLAGAAGVDVVLLVVAADEGVMPQTREHLDIIDLLGVKAGIIALTKTDLVGPDEIELAEDEVRELVEGTVLENAPVLPVSAVTRDGLDELTAAIAEAAAGVMERSASGSSRLPVDRVFSLAGHGTIVTGTLWSGSVSPGDRLQILPRGSEARVRSVQVHDSPVERAEAGQRTAIGLAGVDRDGISRGDTLCAPGTLHVTHMMDARLRLVKNTRPLRNRTRVHLHLGTAETLARIVLLEAEEIAPGEEGLVQIRTETPMVADRDDLFVVRSYSPVATMGGGRVIDAEPERHKRMKQDVLEALAVLEEGSPEDVLIQLVEGAGVEGLSEPELRQKLGSEDSGVAERLVEAGRLVRLEGRYHTSAGLEEVRGRIIETLAAHRKSAPLDWGMSSEELRGKLSRGMDRRTLDAMLAPLVEDGHVSRRGDLVRLGGEDVDLSDAHARLASEIESRVLDAGASVPSLDELRDEFGGADFDAIVKLLVETGRLTKVTTTLLYHPKVIDDIRERLLRRLDEDGEVSVPLFKDMIDVSRKFAIPLLEFFDREGTTMRSGNARVKGRNAR